jgi:hypothetical protein
MPCLRALALVIKEIEEVLPPVLPFAVGFNVTELPCNLAKMTTRPAL